MATAEKTRAQAVMDIEAQVLAEAADPRSTLSRRP